MAPAPETSSARWDKEADIELVRAIAQVVLNNRAAIYRAPALAAFAGNRGSNINAKIQLQLRKYAVQFGAEEVLKEEVAKLGRGGVKRKSGELEEGSAPKKASAKKAKAGKKVQEVGSREGGTESDE